MSPRLEQIEAEAMRLGSRERAELAQRLFATLEDDGAASVDAEVEAEWLEEAERRYARYAAGETAAVPSGEALERVRSRLRRP